MQRTKDVLQETREQSKYNEENNQRIQEEMNTPPRICDNITCQAYAMEESNFCRYHHGTLKSKNR